ncbi:MAG: MFS transporter [Saprospiraceae bacterium]
MAKTDEEIIFTSRYKKYVLLLLTGVYTFNFIDRQLLVILQESIKAELGLSDTQLGLLTGLVFALFYVILGIPIARWADKSNRKNIIAGSLAIWSFMTAVSGMVTSYWQLALARLGVGIGEAGGSPPSHSIISDYFPPERRATALSIYSMGIYIGILFGYTAGGWIGQNYGWRVAFFAVGLPGVLLAVILYYTLKEPPKGHSDPEVLKTSEESSFWDVVKLLMSKKSFIFLALGCGLHTFATYGVGNFFAPFLSRVHEMPIAQIGLWMGLGSGIGGMIGTFGGGYLADIMVKKDVRWYFWIAIIAGLINFPASFVTFFSDNTQLVLIMYFFTSMLTAFYLAPCIAVTHNLVDAKKRALASAILFLILNLIGLGFGPLSIGIVSDLLADSYGVESLRYAFCITFGTSVMALIMFFYAAQNYKKESLLKPSVL